LPAGLRKVALFLLFVGGKLAFDSRQASTERRKAHAGFRRGGLSIPLLEETIVPISRRKFLAI
jgi:hypothetical protein